MQHVRTCKELQKRVFQGLGQRRLPSDLEAGKLTTEGQPSFNTSEPQRGDVAKEKGTKENPWALKTPPGTSEFQAYRDESSSPPALVVWVGKTELRYDLRCLKDLQAMLKSHGDWMLLGSADEQKPAAEGTIESWGRSAKNPLGGWYGLKKGLRGRFAMYVPPVMEALKLAEVEHNPKNNRMRAL